jgi:hypothetical protein
MTMTKVMAFYNALEAQKGILVDVLGRMEKSIVDMLTTLNTVKKNQVWIYLGHEMGIPHTVVDFNDEDENGIAKSKVFDYISVNPDTGELVVMFDNGTVSDRFSIDDMAYLTEDLLAEVMDIYTSKE